MQSKHTKNLQVGFGLSLLLLLASSVASFISIRQMIRSSGWVNHTHVVLQKLEEVISFTKDAETGQRGFLLVHDVSYLAPYNGSFDKVMYTLDEIRKMTLDNPEQQQHIIVLKDLVQQRFHLLKLSIDNVQANQAPDPVNLARGRALMDQCRAQVDKMKESEEKLLAERITQSDRFTRITPILIIIAAILAILVTLYFYKRVSGNFSQINRLNAQLSEKDRQIAARITATEKIAARISGGDYATRASAEDNDDLGSLAGSLNRMAESLEQSFKELSDKQWLQRGTAELNEKMVGEQAVQALANNITSFLVNYSGGAVGAFYVVNGDQLELQGSFALARNKEERIPVGQGLVGQSVLDGKPALLEEIGEDDFMISFTAGEIKPRSIYVFPVRFEGRITAAIEVGSRGSFTALHHEFFRRVSDNIGIALSSAYNRVRLQELLEETQTQSEELQAQHSELEGLNTELEAQAHKLQASEEELKVQQEELMETNQELEERSRLLEEKNHLIVVRNLEIQKKAEELAQNARYKSEFLANMSHELRTPLNSILLLSRLLSENADNSLKDEQVEYAKVILSSGNGLLQLIDEILDLSKIEAGKMQLDYEQVPVRDITTDMSNLFGPLAKEKNVTFNIHTDPALPSLIETDKMRLGQILKNLLSNALKFTNKGFINFSIAPNKSKEGYIDFAVKDSGIGIPSDKQQLIFEAFQQADGSTRRKFGGTGLGLSISRQLALLLGGDISLTSEVGQGSEFIVTVPFSKDLVPAAAVTATGSMAAAVPEQTEAPGRKEEEQLIKPDLAAAYTSMVIPAEIPDDRNNIQPDDKVILIIEDDTAFARTLLDFTRKKGYKGIVAVRGDQGLELAHQYKASGILLDIQLPVKSGWEVMEELKSDSQTRHIPVHIMSSFEVKKESLTRGAVDFVYKPAAFDKMDDVFRKIEGVIKGGAKKVLIVEDNAKHARALAYFLSTYNINSTISVDINDSVHELEKKEVDCVILDMGIPDIKAYETLDTVKKNAGLENVPVLIFTGKSISRSDELKIKQYADSIIVKTAHSYQRILDEVSLFLHLVEENNKPQRPVSRGTRSLAEVLHNKKVLVADDDVRNIFSLTKILEKHKMQVVSAIDGREALDQLEKNPDTNIVLMDIMMPEMDGFEAIARIRQEMKWKKLPVIAVTAKAMTGDREKCIKAGASDYISKPVDIDQLISLLRIWLYESA